MKENYDFSKGRKNPYAKRLKEEGYSVLIHYNPKEAKKKQTAPLSEEEADFETYRKAHE